MYFSHEMPLTSHLCRDNTPNKFRKQSNEHYIHFAKQKQQQQNKQKINDLFAYFN